MIFLVFTHFEDYYCCLSRGIQIESYKIKQQRRWSYDFDFNVSGDHGVWYTLFDLSVLSEPTHSIVSICMSLQ